MPQDLYELPTGWKWVTINDEFDVRDGTHDSPKYQNNGFPLITSKNLGSDGLNFEKVKYISEDDFVEISKRSKVDKGDILFAMIGTIGNPVVVEVEPSFAIKNVALFKPRAKRRSMYFLRYFLSSPHIIETMMKDSKGAAQKFVGLGYLRKFNFPLPPLVEQERIVEKLNALFFRIDAVTARLNQILTHTKALFASESNRCFENLSEKYGRSKLSEVVKINSGIALPKIFKDWMGQGNISFYKVAQMNNDDRIMTGAEITFNAEVADANRIKLFPAGSVLLPKRGGAILTNKKRLLLEDASYDSNVMGLKADETIVSNEYVFRFLLSIDLGDFVDASTIPQINNKHIAQMQIPLPPLEEQQRIVEHLDGLSSRIQTLEKTTRERIAHLAALKASLLDAAFRGQL